MSYDDISALMPGRIVYDTMSFDFSHLYEKCRQVGVNRLLAVVAVTLKERGRVRDAYLDMTTHAVVVKLAKAFTPEVIARHEQDLLKTIEKTLYEYAGDFLQLKK